MGNKQVMESCSSCDDGRDRIKPSGKDSYHKESYVHNSIHFMLLGTQLDCSKAMVKSNCITCSVMGSAIPIFF